MALVNILRFNARSGAILSDEEHWNIFWRKRLHGDNLHSLLTEEMADAWGMEVAYGAVGYPSFHKEVLGHARAELARRLAGQAGAEVPPSTVKDVARIAFEGMREAVRRRIDQKLLFLYGFDTRDLHRGWFERDGQRFEIQTKAIKEAATKLAEGDQQDTLLKAVYSCRAAVFGLDEAVGITAYYLSPEKWIMGYSHEGFEAIGTGKYASGMVFGRDFIQKNFEQRQQGYDVAEGLFELIHSGLVAGDHFKEVGGNLNLVLIDGQGETHSDRYREIFDETARLASEVVRGFWGEQITRRDAIALLDRLILRREAPEKVEKAMFRAAKSEQALDLVLRRYKLKEIPHLLEAPSSGKAPRRKGGRK